MYELLLGLTNSGKPNPIDPGWTQLTNGNLSMVSMGIAVVGDYIHVFGGDYGGGKSNTHQKYHVPSKTWTPCASMPAALSDMAVAVTPDGTFHVLGGLNNSNQPVNTHSMYTAATDKWSSMPATPLAVSGAAATYYPVTKQIILVGGKSAAALAVGSTYRYTKANNSWVGMAAYPASVSGFSGIVNAKLVDLADEREVFLIGGAEMASSGSSTTARFRVMALDLINNRWRDTGHTMPRYNSGGTVAVVEGKAYLYGTLASPQQQIDIYDRTQWKSIPIDETGPSYRQNAVAAGYKDGLFIYGGALWPVGTIVNELWQYGTK